MARGFHFTDYCWKILLSCSILWIIIPTSDAMRCEHSFRDFTCIGRHSWRCKGRTTSDNTPVSSINSSFDPFGTINESSSSNVNIQVQAQEYNSDDIRQMSVCACGKQCKNKRGLKTHQRSCEIAKSECPNTNSHSPPGNNQSAVEVNESTTPSLLVW